MELVVFRKLLEIISSMESVLVSVFEKVGVCPQAEQALYWPLFAVVQAGASNGPLSHFKGGTMAV